MKNIFKSNIIIWQFAGLVAVTLLGSILHFLYDWTGDNTFIALFSSVNESTWEHMKLLFFPMALFTIVQSFFIGKEYENFWCIKLGGMFLGLVAIPVLFYTLNGIFGTTPDWVNIGIFFIAIAIGYIWETWQFNKGSMPCKAKIWAIVALCLIAIGFWVFTFIPPKIPLFQDPINGSFGII